jgi:hypothetical protein
MPRASLLGRRCHAPLRRAPFGRRMNRPVSRGAARSFADAVEHERRGRSREVRGFSPSPFAFRSAARPPRRARRPYQCRLALLFINALDQRTLLSSCAASIRFARGAGAVDRSGRHSRALQAGERVPARARAAARGGEDFAPRCMSSAAAALRWRRTLRRLAQSRQRGWARHVSAIICCEDRTLWLQSLGCAPPARP